MFTFFTGLKKKENLRERKKAIEISERIRISVAVPSFPEIQADEGDPSVLYLGDYFI